MHRDRRRAGISALALAAGALLSIPTLAQTTEPGAQETAAGKAPASVAAHDSALPGPEELTPQTDSRRFVESFLVSMLQRDPELVYDTYLHNQLKDKLDREAFLKQLEDLSGAVGGVKRLNVLYLREENARYDGADGGWAEYSVVTERDPQVMARVDFRRGGDGRWRVFDYTVQSAQMERLHRARAAAEEEVRRQKAADPAAEPPSPQP